MRKETFEERPITKRFLMGVKVSCDLCGFDEDDSYIFEVKVCVAENGCAGTRITRDVCQDCYEEKLEQVFDEALLALDPGNTELNEAHEDRWYG